MSAVPKPRQWTQTDPRIIRAALADADLAGTKKAAEAHAVDQSQIYEWLRWRRRFGDWPNEADIANWDAWEAAHAANRARVNRTLKKRTLLRRPLTIPSVGTARRLRALNRLGWSEAALGRELGVGKKRIGQLMAMQNPTVYLATAQRVAEVYGRLSMTCPDGWHADRSRREAEAKGYHPPLAWDDDEIDDPAARPRYGTAARTPYDEALVIRFVETGRKHRKLRHDEAAEAYRRLRLRGFTGREIEERWGLNPERYKARGGEVA